MSRWKTTFRILVALLAGFAAFVLVAKFGIDAGQGEPYSMTLRRTDGQAFVRFARADVKLVSPEFRVDIPLETPRVILLRSDDVSIPGCVIEFFDTTILPGRFKIRIGEVLYDVMERAILVDDKEFDWQRL
jgi:hypothetical protein